MKKAILINSLIATALITASPVFAQSADVSKIQSFLENVIQVLVTLAGITATAFFVWGGFRYITSSGNPEALVKDGISMINTVLQGFSGIKGLHICRGNDKNRFMAKGGYEAIAKTVFKKAKVDRLLLEFDSERSGDFSPLCHVPKDKIVVLGLISTKTPKLESVQDILKRVEEAAKFVPKERLAISTQCGFASVAKGNNLSFKDQENKLKLVSKVAKEVWKD